MRSYDLYISPRDPIIARDSRPFGAGQGNRMKSLPWLYPSVLSGSLRTLLGKLNGAQFDSSIIEKLKQIEVAGPFPFCHGQIYFPAPADLIFFDCKSGESSKRSIMPFRPMQISDGWGCDLQAGLLPISITQDVKPAKAPAFWSLQQLCKWLGDASGDQMLAPQSNKFLQEGYMDLPELEERVHVNINSETGAATESHLFTSVGMSPTMCVEDTFESIDMVARIQAQNGFEQFLDQMNTLHPLGGERRLAHWSTQTLSNLWSCPKDLCDKLNQTSRVRMILASPAIFTEGWRPGWLGEGCEGTLPGSNLRLKLTAACINRWKAISGWSLEAGKIGPKPIRRMAPSGSVYFFEILDGDVSSLSSDLWLTSVCDEKQDRLDGFGRALWGIWDYAK